MVESAIGLFVQPAIGRKPFSFFRFGATLPNISYLRRFEWHTVAVAKLTLLKVEF